MISALSGKGGKGRFGPGSLATPRGRVGLAVLCLVVSLAGPAGAVTYRYVKPAARGGSAGNSGADSANAWTLHHANLTATAGVTIVVLPGNYSSDTQPNCDTALDEPVQIYPRAAGLGGHPDSSIRYVGNENFPSNHAVHSIEVHKAYISVIGIRSINTATFSQWRRDAPGASCVYDGSTASRCSLSYSRTKTLNWAGATECVAYRDSVTIGKCSGSGCALGFVEGAPTGFSYGGRPAKENVFRRGVVTIDSLDADSRGIYFANRARYNRFDSTRVTCTFRWVTLASGARTALLWSANAHTNYFTDNRWTASAASATPSGWDAIYLRDSTHTWSFVRDTFDIGFADTASVDVNFLLAASGSYPDVNYPGNKRWNTWDNCHFKVGGIIWAQDGAHEYSFLNSTFYFHEGDEFQLGVGKTYGWTIDHCTFYGVGKRPFKIFATPQPGLTTVVQNCIFYRTSTAAHAESTVTRYDSGNVPQNLQMNQNLYYSPTDSAHHAISWGSSVSNGCLNDCFSAPCDPSRCWTLFSLRDYSSKWGNPRFTTTHRDSFYGHVFCNTGALKIDPDSAVGAQQPQLFARPAPITDLRANGSPTTSSVPLQWTAPGDDSLSGQAILYDVRYSANPITDDDAFLAATFVSGTPAPAVGGVTQTFTVTGLSADTQYYFAVKTYNTCLNLSALSNSFCSWTLPVSGPAHTCE